MQARLRRLRSDHARVTEVFAEHPFVSIAAVEGDPPEKYTFDFLVRGLVPRDEGEPLPLMVTRIAEMICFQSYNVKSPLNARAAAWAEQNLPRLPLQRGDFTVGL